MIDALSGNSIRTRQVLLTALFSTARTQFAFANDLIDALGDTLRNTGPAGDHAAFVETLITRFRERTEDKIAELQRISAELRDNAEASVATSLARAGALTHGER